MRFIRSVLAIAVLLSAFSSFATTAEIANVQFGPRPFYLVDKVKDKKLKKELQRCKEGPFYVTDFSIGHRGAALQFPEHTKESYEAAARMGAGIIECDVTFTKDGELVCRHAQCDLHTTTNIVATELAGKCSVPPEFDPVTGELTNAADIKCCTSDMTLEEFKLLEGKMDAANTKATSVEAYLGGTANWRTDLYATGGTLLSHAESIALIRRLGAKFTPELKGGDPDAIKRIFGSQENYAQKMLDEYIAADIPPQNVWPQSFNREDVLYWIDNEPAYGKQAVYLVEPDPIDTTPSQKWFNELKRDGVNIVAPPMPTLLQERGGKIKPSIYARRAKAAGLDIITWTIERSGRIAEDVLPTKKTGSPSFYYQTTLDALENDGDIMMTLDVLARQVGILGIFSDWPATVTYYANCRGL